MAAGGVGVLLLLSNKLCILHCFVLCFLLLLILILFTNFFPGSFSLPFSSQFSECYNNIDGGIYFLVDHMKNGFDNNEQLFYDCAASINPLNVGDTVCIVSIVLNSR